MCFLGLVLWATLRAAKDDCHLLLNSNYFNYKTNTYTANKTIILKKNIIADIVDANSIQYLGTNCQSLDLKGAYLFPGFIDSHSHLLAFDKQRVSSWRSALELSSVRSEKMRLLVGEKNATSLLLAGFTTVRDLGNSGFHLDEQLKSRISDKLLAGPQIITSGPGITIEPSQIDLKYSPREYTLVSERSDIDRILQDYKSHNVSWIKLYADNSGRGSLIKQDLLETLTRKAQNLNLKVAIHAEYAQSIVNALNATPNSIEHFYEIPNFDTKPMKNFPYIVLTDYSLKTCENMLIEKNCKNKINSLKNRLTWLRQNNFKLVFGSDSVLDFTSNFKTRGEASLAALISLEQLGLSPLDVLLSATVTPAEMLGLPIGKIEKHHKANLVAFSSDPIINLDNIKTRTLVIFNGKIVCKKTQECLP